MLRPGSLLSRSLALVLMLGVSLAVYKFALLPLIGVQSGTKATIEQTEALLQRYHALAEQRARVADQVSAYEKLVADADSYLPGPDTVVAAAALQERAKSVIERADGELRSIQVLPAQAFKTAVPVCLIALKIQFIIDIDGLRDVLYVLETGNPYLFIEELRVHRNEAISSDPALDVTITIEGYTIATSGSPVSDAGPDFSQPVGAGGSLATEAAWASLSAYGGGLPVVAEH